MGGRRFAGWRVIGRSGPGFDAADVLEKQGEAGGTGRIFTHDGETGLRFGSGFGIGFGGFFLGGFFRGGRPVEFVELFEETEFALEGAFGGGCIAKAEVVFFDFVGGPVER